MWVYSKEEKIYAAWDYNHRTEWHPKHAFDASADGLSGKVEGFYLANWLMPFTIPVQFQGVAISPTNYPTCIAYPNPELSCKQCKFFQPDRCPILEDSGNLILSQYGFRIYLRHIQAVKGDNDVLCAVAHHEMLAHGRPLHYQMVNRILQMRYAIFNPTARKVRKALHLNPVFFDYLGEGVYQAIPGRKMTFIDIEFAIGFD